VDSEQRRWTKKDERDAKQEEEVEKKKKKKKNNVGKSKCARRKNVDDWGHRKR
jgi:hypothetical protein